MHVSKGRIGGGWGGCEGLSVFASRAHDVASAAGRIIKGTQICRALRVPARAEWLPRKVPNQSALPPNCRAGVRRRRLEFSGAAGVGGSGMEACRRRYCGRRDRRSSF